MGARSAATKAGKLAELAVPEVGVPIELAKALKTALQRPQTSPPAGPAVSTVIEGPSAGPVVIQLPADPLIVLKKSSVRVIMRKGERIIIAKPARGVNAKEAIATLVIAALGYGAYRFGKVAEADLTAATQGPHSTASFPASLNPLTWRP